MPGQMPRAQSTCGWVRVAVQMGMAHRAEGSGQKEDRLELGAEAQGRRVAQVS